MRDITDIISELMEHPDYVAGRIWTKNDIVMYIMDFDDIPYERDTDIDDMRLKDLILEDEKDDIGDYIESVFNQSDEYIDIMDNIDCERISTAIRREININKIL